MIEKILNIGNYQYLSELYTGDDFRINESDIMRNKVGIHKSTKI